MVWVLVMGLWALAQWFGWGFGCGMVLRWWWERVHGPRIGARGATWLALLAQHLPIGFLLMLSVLPNTTFRMAPGHTLDLLQIVVLALWVAFAPWRRAPVRVLWLTALALLSQVVRYVFIALGGEYTLNPTWTARGWEATLDAALESLFLLLGARLALSAPATSMPASAAPEIVSPLPEPDADGVVRYLLLAHDSTTSYLLTFLASLLMLPALLLALRPSLYRSKPIAIAIWGEAVEIDDGQKVRLAMSGGAVRQSCDLLGSPVLTLEGRDKTHTLPLGGVPLPVIDDLLARLREATGAPKAEPLPPVPEEMQRLQDTKRAVSQPLRQPQG